MRAAGDLGYVKSVDALRLKAVDASGEKLLYEDKPLRLIAAFAGSADWQKAKPITSYLLVLATGAKISINGTSVGSDSALLLSPKPGSYTIRAILPDGSILEEGRNLSVAAAENLRFATTGSIEVSTRTAGELSVDGRPVKMIGSATGARVENLTAGTYALELRYADGKKETIAVAVSAGGRAIAAFSWSDRFVRVPEGSFAMGDYGNQHLVCLSAFSIAATEVTFDEYDAHCAATGTVRPGDSRWGRGSRPVINVSWYDAVNYCNWRSKSEGLSPGYTISGTNVAMISVGWSSPERGLRRFLGYR